LLSRWKSKRAARGAERQVAELVEDHEVGAVRLSAICPALPLAFSCSRALTSSMVEKKRTLAMMLDGLDAEGGGDMGLAGAGPADQDDVLGAVDELAAVQLADQWPR
jgi:hypothetical protein